MEIETSISGILLISLFVLIVNICGENEEYPTPPPPTVNIYDQNCTDKINDCLEFGIASCFKPYEEWAKENCAKTCKFCQGKPEKPPTCSDEENGCELYTDSICTNPKFVNFARARCRRFCRLCPEPVLAELDKMKTTLPPADCFDKALCSHYGKAACTEYKDWAKSNCAKYCGFCSTGTPVKDKPCLDKIPNCSQYNIHICTDLKYASWVDENCRQTCNICSMTLKPIIVPTPQPVLTPQPPTPRH